MKLNTIFSGILAILPGLGSTEPTYFNPVLPGWHSDPSCVQVNGTFFCATSTFLSFPGIPIYASKDLINWKLVSHVWGRESQLPGISWNTTALQGGLYAPTLRYHDGEFYVASNYIVSTTEIEVLGLVFKTSDPFEPDGWSDPVQFDTSWRIDPDLFWDDDGTLYVATSGIFLQTLDLSTGGVGEPINIWNGTGGESPEGPHIYKRDEWYYLMIAEGGTGLNHSITIARATNITGPYYPCGKNPILTNSGTDEYFQTVGHGDLFQDVEGNWWGMCLATRSGPEYEVYPMGREAALFPVSWEEGLWPVMEPVRGMMNGWTMPTPSLDPPGSGPFNSDPDIYDFDEGSTRPLNLVYARVPKKGILMTEKGMQIIPTRSNLTGSQDANAQLTGQHGVGFVGRAQTDSFFNFSVDLLFNPQKVGEEAGVSIFLTQHDHIDLGIVLLKETTPTNYLHRNFNESSRWYFHFHTQSTERGSTEQLVPVPASWTTGPIRLEVTGLNSTYTLSAMSTQRQGSRAVIYEAPASIVSGGSGSFMGSLVGGFATCNGAGSADNCPRDDIAYFQRWRYIGLGQLVSYTEFGQRALP